MGGNPVRKSILYSAAGAVLGAAAVLVVVFAATQDGVEWPADGVGTFLWAIRDSARGELLGVAAFTPSRIAVVTIPSDVSVKGADGRFVQIGRLGETEGWGSACAAASRLLGVDVVGYAVADGEDVETYCDAIGPVMVDCAAPVAGSSPGMEIGRGRRELAGDDVLSYVTGASAATAAERCEQVVHGIVDAAGTRPPREALRLVSNLGRAELAQIGATLTRSGAQITMREMPTALVVRDGVTRRVARAVETEKLMASLVRAEDPLTPEDLSVAVFNGNGARLAATQAATYLQARGFRVGRIGNADSFDYATTTIVRLTDEARAWILRESLPGPARIVTPVEFGAHYESLRPLVPQGTDLVLVVGAGMEWTR